MNKKKKVNIPVIEEGVIRKEDITDGEAAMLAFKTLMSWVQESKKKSWKKKEKYPIALFVVDVNPDDYWSMKVSMNSTNPTKKKVKMSMLAFANAFTPGELKSIMEDVVNAYIKGSIIKEQTKIIDK